jgi:hypothetical protein
MTPNPLPSARQKRASSPFQTTARTARNACRWSRSQSGEWLGRGVVPSQWDSSLWVRCVAPILAGSSASHIKSCMCITSSSGVVVHARYIMMVLSIMMFGSLQVCSCTKNGNFHMNLMARQGLQCLETEQPPMQSPPSIVSLTCILMSGGRGI